MSDGEKHEATLIKEEHEMLVSEQKEIIKEQSEILKEQQTIEKEQEQIKEQEEILAAQRKELTEKENALQEAQKDESNAIQGDKLEAKQESASDKAEQKQDAKDAAPTKDDIKEQAQDNHEEHLENRTAEKQAQMDNRECGSMDMNMPETDKCFDESTGGLPICCTGILNPASEGKKPSESDPLTGLIMKVSKVTKNLSYCTSTEDFCVQNLQGEVQWNMATDHVKVEDRGRKMHTGEDFLEGNSEDLPIMMTMSCLFFVVLVYVIVAFVKQGRKEHYSLDAGSKKVSVKERYDHTQMVEEPSSMMSEEV